MDLSVVKQVKILKNEITVNSLLDKDWILLEITNNGTEVDYHLGLIPGIRKKIDALEGQVQEQDLSIYLSDETLLNKNRRKDLLEEIETLLTRYQENGQGLHLMISFTK